MVKIRKAMIQDAPALADLSSQLGYPATGKQSAERLAAILASDGHAVFAACVEDGSVAGWLHVCISLRIASGAFAEIGGLIVAEKHRRRGIGARLLEAAEDWAKRRSLCKIRVRPRATRRDAHQFYANSGYAKTKEQFVFDKPLEA